MTQLRDLALVLLTLLLASTGHAAPQPSGDPPAPEAREAAEWDVREAVFRHQLEENASGAQQSVAYYFLALGESSAEREDPPPEFLERFEGHTPEVLPVSKSILGEHSVVVHEDDGKKGLIFQITGLQWIDETTVEVQGGYYEASLSASGNLYRVEKQGDEWVVTDDRMLWIS